MVVVAVVVWQGGGDVESFGVGGALVVCEAVVGVGAVVGQEAGVSLSAGQSQGEGVEGEGEELGDLGHWFVSGGWLVADTSSHCTGCATMFM